MYGPAELPRRPTGGDTPPDERLARLTRRSAERRRALGAPSSRSSAAGMPPPPPRRTSRRRARRHPAKGSRLVALALSIFSTLALGVYLEQANAGSKSSSIPLVTLPASTSDTTGTSESGSGSNSPTTTTTAPSSTGLRDGTFTGATSTNKYGNVQVQVIVAAGKLTKVNIVQYPDNDGKSVRINSDAIPTLIAETLSAQSAKVDTVSGATYTSTSYRQSMQAAIDQARTSSTST
jgi:uncharacterized protein with FMN-binding domain